MTPRTLLNGEVEVRRLEHVSDGGPFLAADPRGDVAYPVVGEPFDFMHVVEYARGGVRRGLHAHPGHEEHFAVFRGAMRLAVRSPTSGETAVVALSRGDVVRMGPGVAHAVEALEPGLTVHWGRGTDPLASLVRVPEMAAVLDGGVTQV